MGPAVATMNESPMDEWDRWSHIYCILRARLCSETPRNRAGPRCICIALALCVAEFHVNSDMSDFDVVKSLEFATPQFVGIRSGWSSLGMLRAPVVPHWGFG